MTTSTSASTASGSASTSNSSASPPSGAPEIITLVPSQTFQTIRGWEATVSPPPNFSPDQWDAFTTHVAQELGITRIRLDLALHTIESTRASNFTLWTNDNSNPFNILPSGFNFTASFHSQFTNLIFPLKQKVEAMGDTFEFNATAVGFDPSALVLQTTPEEYAELVESVLIHLRDTYNFEPDIWEIRNEPDVGSGSNINGTQEGNLIAAAGPRIRNAGFNKMKFTGPGTSRPSNLLSFTNAMLGVPGVSNYMGQLSYHRYGGGDLSLADWTLFSQMASQIGASTAMTEWCWASHHALYEDLVRAQVTSWEKYVLLGGYGGAWPNPWQTQGACSGNQLYYLDTQTMEWRFRIVTYYLRQYFKYIRPGAVRIGINQNVWGLKPVAFTNPTGKHVAVFILSSARNLEVRGLNPGTYEITYVLDVPSTAQSVPSGTHAPVSVTISQPNLRTFIPGPGTITIRQL